MMHNLSMFEGNEKKSSGSLPQVFSYQRAEENVQYLFSGWFSEFGLSIKKIRYVIYMCYMSNNRRYNYI